MKDNRIIHKPKHYRKELEMLVLYSNLPIEQLDKAFSAMSRLEGYLSQFNFEKEDKDEIFLALQEAKLRVQKAFQILKKNQVDIET